jgi:8-oxo-dGTP pyrophosphatase MutT (NUDIX family)
MMAEPQRTSSVVLEPILAGGGIVAGSETGKIAVVHRRRYAGEIGLPKGKVKVEEGEAVVDGAEREVGEETGYRVRAIAFAGLTYYFTNGRPKVVFYYRMEIIGEGNGIDTGEIQSVAWMTPEDAAAALTHAEDRRLITTVFALRGR